MFCVVIAQAVLTALAAWSLVSYLSREIRLNCVVSLILLGILLGVPLLCRFAAGRTAMYSNFNGRRHLLFAVYSVSF